MKCFRTDLYKWLLTSYVNEEFLSQEYVYKFFTYRSVETYDLSVLFFRVVKPWKQRYYVPWKRLCLHRSPRCVTTQNIIIEFFTHMTANLKIPVHDVWGGWRWRLLQNTVLWQTMPNFCLLSLFMCRMGIYKLLVYWVTKARNFRALTRTGLFCHVL